MATKRSKPTLDLQQVILGLQEFWARQGCLIWQPYNVQVGAGTMNPATFLRVLGPEPWNTAYVEPSVRPADGRYGENPNRLQQYYQFQVILKPDPGDPQGIYLRSLEALGIDIRENDVRFVEDNWESPALGAWGLGWEVWLNGLEITQFTYFQQAGGIELPVPSVEITYGIERILMALQKVSHFKDIHWVDRVNYGDIFLDNEREQSRYNFEVADVERLRGLYEAFEAEARAALAAELVLPAHEYVLKCSHTFNVLDARGAIGVTERAHFFGRMRNLAREVAQAYLQSRAAAGYPLKGKFRTAAPVSHPARKKAVRRLTEPAMLIFEIGVEELPPADASSARTQMADLLSVKLRESRLRFGTLQVLGTPRRIAALVSDVAPVQDGVEQVIRGPSAEKARNPDGSPTPALEGFARKNNVSPEKLAEEKGYMVFRRREAGKPAMDILPLLLAEALSGMQFGKAMRWNETGAAFSRPVRWLLALLGESTVPVEWNGLQGGSTTHGLRSAGSPALSLRDAREYRTLMQAQGIEPDPETRRAKIRDQAQKLAAKAGGEAVFEEGLLEEVTDLVESPHTILGSFDRAYLSLPREVLISVMRKHQRYFPVKQGKELLPCFLAVRNGNGAGEGRVREGNEHVLRARFADAAYFIQEDRKRPLEDFRPRLSALAFQKQLGSMLEKSERLERLAVLLCPICKLSESETRTVRRAAHLCKADLATQMVVEMTSLQGVMGRYYALDAGEPPEVADAIYEHYLPRGAEDSVPESSAGTVLALADRLDSLSGLFAAGLAPTGTRDPFALRRLALGLIQILLARGTGFDLREAVRLASSLQPIPVSEETRTQILDFLAGRLRGVLAEAGFRYDVVEAVLGAQAHNPLLARRNAEELSRWVEKPGWADTLAAFARCVRITREFTERFPVDPAVFQEDAEKALWNEYSKMRKSMEAQRSAGSLSVEEFLNAFTPGIPAINEFFDKVLVMTDDPAVRKNRLGVLQHIAGLTDGLADLSKLEGF